jgi:beta-lactam-binding protein with PASTA domain/tRNA A-37 threonylcarbamoyl transferase component Bud32
VSETTAPTVLDGRYRLLAQLAVGSTSTVHLAEDTVLGRTVALKVLHPHLADDDAVVDRFRREALAAASLSHPHVVTMFDVARDGAYLVMEHVDGPSLRDVLRLRGRMEPREALALLGPVASGLSAAHAAGLVHRDVKPENVLMGADGRVRIGDFGLARNAASASTTFGPDMFAGSPSYASPEAVRGEVLDARSDVYALGVLLYECMTGVAPFRADTPFSTAMMHTTHRVPPPSERVPEVPRAVDAVVRRATAPDPEDRYADAAAFATALQHAVPDGPVAVDLRDGGRDTVVIPVDASETVVTGRAGTPASRRLAGALRRRWLAIVAVLAVLLAGGGWLAWDQVVAPVTAIPTGLVGAEPAAAEAALAEAGFTAATAQDRPFSLEVPEGRVLGVDPDDRARQGTTVVLVLSAGPRQVEVPGVTGSTREEAVGELEAADFVPQVEEAFNETVEAGRVVSTDPSPGTRVDQGSDVTVVVSRGRRPIEVPGVAGRPEGEAVAAIEDARLAAEVVDRQYSDDVPAGAVIAQTPTPDQGPLFRGDVVELVVSDGPEPFELPSVREFPEDQAVAQLEDLGLQVEVSYVNALFGIGAGRVGQQSPSAGTQVVRGDTVKLVVLR